MARKIGLEAPEQKIEKAKKKVIRTKDAYDGAVDELQALLDKQTALRAGKIMKAIVDSDKSYDEILQFITGDRKSGRKR